MIRPIRVLGDPVLRRRAEPVAKIDDSIRQLADDMFETMHAAKGIGLAAPQVGVSERVFVADVDGARFVMVNPELVEVRGPVSPYEEGCLSIPEILGEVNRATDITMRALDLKGEPITVNATELLARCFQHELDHLNGKLFVDYLSLLKKRRALSQWAKLEKDFPGHVRVLTPGDPGETDPEHPNEPL
ncbi:MAG TPA: peptide deformylase [Gemmatimonadaceae bacterium]|nr:peptide deformylase [Gemmatimonadaceae bacterium]